MKPSWTSEFEQKSNSRATAFKPSTESGMMYYQQSLTDPLTFFGCKLKSQKKSIKYLLQVYAQEQHLSTQIELLQVEVDGPTTSQTQIKGSHFKARNREED